MKDNLIGSIMGIIKVKCCKKTKNKKRQIRKNSLLINKIDTVQIKMKTSSKAKHRLDISSTREESKKEAEGI